MKEKKLNKLLGKIFGETQIERDVRCPIGRIIRHRLMANKYGDMQQYHMDACEYWANKVRERTGNNNVHAIEPEVAVNGVSADEDGLFHPFKPVVFH